MHRPYLSVGRLAAIPIFALWLFTWCMFFGCSRQVVVTQEDSQSDTVETHIVRVSEVSGMGPDGAALGIGQTLSIPHLSIRLVRVSDSVIIVRTPVRTDTRSFVRYVSGRTVIKNAFNQDSYNKTDTNNKRAIIDSPESGNRLKKSQHRSSDSGNRSKQVDKDTTNFPWWWWLIILVLGIVVWLFRKYAGKFMP